MIKLLTITLLAVLATGCASTPASRARADQRATQQALEDAQKRLAAAEKLAAWNATPVAQRRVILREHCRTEYEAAYSGRNNLFGLAYMEPKQVKQMREDAKMNYDLCKDRAGDQM